MERKGCPMLVVILLTMLKDMITFCTSIFPSPYSWPLPIGDSWGGGGPSFGCPM